MTVIGRLAPSPTGALHLGNARTFLLAWLSIRQQNGNLLLRIEDIDSPRVKASATEEAIDDLRWLGLDWDEGPDVGGLRGPYIQTQRLDHYQKILDQAISDKVVYRCVCSRSEVAEAASAPHETNLPSLEGTIYPGTCRSREFPSDGELNEFAWRWRLIDEKVSWHDELLGPQAAEPAKQLGDFVVGKRDGTPAYQLAVVVDDFEMGVNEVVRGSDLVPSTYRQLALLKHFNWPVPKYFHLPLIVGSDGRRLAKRHGDTRIRYYRQRGIKAQQLVGYLAWTVGLIDRNEPVSASELVSNFSWLKIPLAPTIVNHQFCL